MAEVREGLQQGFDFRLGHQAPPPPSGLRTGALSSRKCSVDQFGGKALLAKRRHCPGSRSSLLTTPLARFE